MQALTRMGKNVLDELDALAHIGMIVVRAVDVRETEMPRIVGGEEGVRAAVTRRWAEIAGVLARRAERGFAAPVLVLRGVKRGMFEVLEAEVRAPAEVEYRPLPPHLHPGRED